MPFVGIPNPWPGRLRYRRLPPLHFPAQHRFQQWAEGVLPTGVGNALVMRCPTSQYCLQSFMGDPS